MYDVCTCMDVCMYVCTCMLAKKYIYSPIKLCNVVPNQ